MKCCSLFLSPLRRRSPLSTRFLSWLKSARPPTLGRGRRARGGGGRRADPGNPTPRPGGDRRLCCRVGASASPDVAGRRGRLAPTAPPLPPGPGWAGDWTRGQGPVGGGGLGGRGWTHIKGRVATKPASQASQGSRALASSRQHPGPPSPVDPSAADSPEQAQRFCPGSIQSPEIIFLQHSPNNSLQTSGTSSPCIGEQWPPPRPTCKVRMAWTLILVDFIPYPPAVYPTPWA